MRKNIALLLMLSWTIVANAQQFIDYGEACTVEFEDGNILSVSDSLLQNFNYAGLTFPDPQPLPGVAFLPAVFHEYIQPVEMPLDGKVEEVEPWMRWIASTDASYRRYQRALRSLEVQTPSIVRYNIATMPVPPRRYEVVVNPEEHTIQYQEIAIAPVGSADLATSQGDKVHWLHDFRAELHFSQAYVSPNWYQGGNNNLNSILLIYYNIKLNPVYHPNLLFETTAQYKLGINSAPDDTIRAYNVSEDIFQVNSVFGVKAAKKWYYSATAQFKTQLVNSYTSNTNNLRSAFMSPGELNVGLGMTYNTANAAKTFTFDANISALSYNLMICTNPNLNATSYGIQPGHKTISKYGSSSELKLTWKMAKNISFTSRFFAFTNYKSAYADWENTLDFAINRFLTTRVFVHLRYDTDTPQVETPDWHKLQVKEILSLGFTYKFSTK